MLEMGLFWLGLVVVGVAYLILLIDLFRHNKIWALVGMVLIIPLIVHAILNWTTLNVRKAFYAFAVGALAVFVSIAGGALSHLPFLTDHEVVQVLEENIAPPKDEPLSNQEEANTSSLSNQDSYDPLLTGSEYEAIEEKELAPKVSKAINTNSPSSRYQLITQNELKHAINKQIRLTLKDGQVVLGVLTNIKEDAVLVESSANGGTFGLSHLNDEIKSVEVLLLDGEQLYIEDVIEEEMSPDESEVQAPEEEIQPAIIDSFDNEISDPEQEVVDEAVEVINGAVDETISESNLSNIQGNTNEVLNSQQQEVDESE